MTKEIAKILIVNGNKKKINRINNMLESESIETYTANNEAEALKVIRYINFNLILVEILLNDPAGFKIADKIKTFDDKLPIIFTADQEFKNIYKKVLLNNGDDIFIRPFRQEKFVMRVHSYLHFNFQIKEIVSEFTNCKKKAQKSEKKNTNKTDSTLILKNIQEPIQILDSKGKIKFENKAAIKLLGKNKGKLAGKVFKQKDFKLSFESKIDFSNFSTQPDFIIIDKLKNQRQVIRMPILKKNKTNYILLIAHLKKSEAKIKQINKKEKKANHKNLRNFLKNF